MKRSLKILLLFLPLCLLCALPASAVTEADVQAAVDAQGKDAVSGNLFLWFLCAIAFLKISTKLDNILHSLGLGAGRKVTGDTTATLAGTSSGGWAAGIGSGRNAAQCSYFSKHPARRSAARCHRRHG